jgi:hypothetical protein
MGEGGEVLRRQAGLTASDPMKIPGADHPITIEPIKEHLAFYPARVDRIEEDEDEAVNN